MDVTSKLVRVYVVDKQLRGLRSRLRGAERFLSEQDKELTSIESQRGALEGEIKKLSALAGDAEGEVKALDAKMAKIRAQMDNAQSNKEYKAFLTELNTFKADRDKHEGTALEQMGRVEELKKQLESLVGRRGEREQVRKVAVSDRDARSSEIADRVRELEGQRETLVSEVPAEVMRDFQRLLDRRGDEAMGIVEIVDVKRHEFHCGSCMMSLPVDAVAMLISTGRLTKCSNCQCVLYVDEAGKELVQNGGKPAKKAAKTPKKDRASAEDIAKSEAKMKGAAKASKAKEAAEA
jgi:predicted  nucleic acid-binding Zn-ribbon protein